jgi:hypothetical protein
VDFDADCGALDVDARFIFGVDVVELSPTALDEPLVEAPAPSALPALAAAGRACASPKANIKTTKSFMAPFLNA